MVSDHEDDDAIHGTTMDVTVIHGLKPRPFLSERPTFNHKLVNGRPHYQNATEENNGELPRQSRFNHSTTLSTKA